MILKQYILNKFLKERRNNMWVQKINDEIEEIEFYYLEDILFDYLYDDIDNEEVCEWIDEICEPCVIFGTKYCISSIIFNLDESKFWSLKEEYINYIIEEIIYKVERAELEEEITLADFLSGNFRGYPFYNYEELRNIYYRKEEENENS